MSDVKLTIDGDDYEFPVVEGSEGEIGIDIAELRGSSGAVALDPGYGNTGSCQSSITYIDGENGVLRYRGYPIEELAEEVSFEEVINLLVWGELPDQQRLEELRTTLAEYMVLDEGIKDVLEAMPRTAHPMAMLSAGMSALETYYDTSGSSEEDVLRVIAGLNTLAAFIYRRKKGLPYVYPSRDLTFAENFLHMMYGTHGAEPDVNDIVADGIDKLLTLHADHEQNCSASTTRMVGSAKSSLYASVAAGVGALSGPLHGGANQAVLEMLREIRDGEGTLEDYVEMAKDKSSDFRLMGFGHRVYKNFDPRAKILKTSADDVLEALGKDDPLLDIARELEEVALEDDFFVDRRLYPNVDFYSGIIYRSLEIPEDMFTVMFALGRVSGWVAQWQEMLEDPAFKIHRPRQVYIGENERSVPPLSER